MHPYDDKICYLLVHQIQSFSITSCIHFLDAIFRVADDRMFLIPGYYAKNEVSSQQYVSYDEFHVISSAATLTKIVF